MSINLETILNLLKRDIKFSFKGVLLKNISFCVYIFIIGIIFIDNLKMLGDLNIGNLIFEVFKGSDFVKRIEESNFPVGWMIINVVILLIIGMYVFRDYSKNGKYIIIRSGKINFWISKIIWVVLNVCLYYALIILTLIVVNLLFGNGFNNLEIGVDGIKIGILEFMAVTFISYAATSITLSIIFVMISIILNQKIGFFILVIFLVLSVYSSNFFMIAQQDMLLRNNLFNLGSDITIKGSVIYNFSLSLIFLVLSTIILEKKDVF